MPVQLFLLWKIRLIQNLELLRRHVLSRLVYELLRVSSLGYRLAVVYLDLVVSVAYRTLVKVIPVKRVPDFNQARVAVSSQHSKNHRLELVWDECRFILNDIRGTEASESVVHVLGRFRLSGIYPDFSAPLPGYLVFAPFPLYPFKRFVLVNLQLLHEKVVIENVLDYLFHDNPSLVLPSCDDSPRFSLRDTPKDESKCYARRFPVLCRGVNVHPRMTAEEYCLEDSNLPLG